MRRFLRKGLLGALGAAGVFLGLVGVRLALAAPALDAVFRLPEGTRVLLTGDSHIGCTFREDVPGVRVIWKGATSPGFTVLRLRNIERLGWPRSLRTVVTEVGPQTLYAEHAESLRAPAWEASLFWAWRFPDAWPWGNTLWRSADFILRTRAAPPATEGPRTEAIPFPHRSEAEQREALETALASHYERLATPSEWVCAEKELREELLALRAFCEAKGVRLVLFSAPLTSYYRRHVPDWAGERFAAFQAWLRAAGFEYHDHRDALDDFWFLDTHHLRPRGAERFTAHFLKAHGLDAAPSALP